LAAWISAGNAQLLIDQSSRNNSVGAKRFVFAIV